MADIPLSPSGRASKDREYVACRKGRIARIEEKIFILDGRFFSMLLNYCCLYCNIAEFVNHSLICGLNLFAEQLEKRLDEISPDTAPHKHYIGFPLRWSAYGYASKESVFSSFYLLYPHDVELISHLLFSFNAENALLQMAKDGVKRAVAFSQYPQWSCTTAGSSMNGTSMILR